MDKGLFANDGSFMERFKQMQQEQEKAATAAASSAAPKPANPKQGFAVAANKRPFELKKAGPVATGGKLAFSLKKAKVAIAPVFAPEDEEEDAADVDREEPAKRQKSVKADTPAVAAPTGAVAPPPPNDMTVRQVADKLASFVAKNGRQFENITRQRNPGDTPFKFLFDKHCPDYKYYEFRLAEEEKILAQSKEAEASRNGWWLEFSFFFSILNLCANLFDVYTLAANNASSKAPIGLHKSSFEQKPSYQTPASALYGAYEGSSSQGSSSSYAGDTSVPSDPVALMEFYMKKAAQEERKRPPRQSKDEMPPPPSLQGPPKKGHHMGDFIPPEELEKFMTRCNDAEAQKATKEAAEKAKIQADNIGHKLLSKMGWREGEGLGSERRGRADPIMAGDVKKDHLGVGAVQPGEVTSEDDIYEQYKKRMMLGYRYRPNPLNNPRKAYY
ncbi:SURP and G-patch domain-containing protein 1-like protein isoform X1 [Panicum virgatum]|uniref:SURP and G-patch domain-containing protein 1-like protein isoform X1 n=1 Tax=Panicum virgatum TaxID=38727 RepID=UPI0019D5F0AF|nr:SURP and G-patch domain-containing protein 1-like protein isoform X1 [Panicum virgatum]XP_039811102.1 SURP and G-patch domain-containing protein 1-like protein isoform X1 [Panicum virgatum]XP_039811111.1 SURP and G-patch domain-containing protein 1-like protein isoform X1 [Panicum virgatum]XP_039811119.1 SURP and G-patch domain-containing protein 1-like protein isoform X1 [Panicum virgatum]XP_039811128.1 SURP and G-patch domain-containing protein 1-like protein isoform X1 [Panicum virgatum]